MVLVTAALNCRLKRKIRTAPDREHAEAFWPGFWLFDDA